MAIYKIILFLMLTLLMVASVTALDCTEFHDDFRPFEILKFICSDVSADSCYTYISHENTSTGVIQAGPETTFSSNGYFDAWVVSNNITVVEFRTKDVRPEINYTFGIQCGLSSWNTTKILHWNTPYSAVRGSFWTLRNRSWIIGGFIALLAFIMILTFLYYQIRGD